ncbi:MAG: tyrosine--tRNA ligase [Candidatus Neomarinimicrobiota bacterium]
MTTFRSVREQMDLIRRGTHEIISEEELEKRLRESLNTGVPLVVKLGCDPSQPDLHLGHAVVLRKLRHFQDLGHQAVLVIGDFTAMIGDPSGRNKTRPQISAQETREHGKTYVEQASLILDGDRLKIVNNSSWLGEMNFGEVIQLASHYTVARMLERDDFEKRYESGTPISIHEFLYPLAQAMDSIKLRADVELGGTDQKFNLLMARDLQRDFDQVPQVVVTTPLLEGTDGVQKMSKSYGNYIGVGESTQEMYGKTMSIPDELILRYFELATDVSGRELRSIEKKLKDPSLNPRDLKRRLAREIVTLYHSEEKAREAEAEFQLIFVQKSIPEDVDSFEAEASPINIVQLLFQSGLASSRGEARRLIQQGAVDVDGKKVTHITTEVELEKERIIKVGKRRFLRVSI